MSDHVTLPPSVWKRYSAIKNDELMAGILTQIEEFLSLEYGQEVEWESHPYYGKPYGSDDTSWVINVSIRKVD